MRAVNRGSVDVERLTVLREFVLITGDTQPALGHEKRFPGGLRVVDELFCDAGAAVNDDVFSGLGDDAGGNESADLPGWLAVVTQHGVVAVRDRPVNEHQGNLKELFL